MQHESVAEDAEVRRSVILLQTRITIEMTKSLLREGDINIIKNREVVKLEQYFLTAQSLVFTSPEWQTTWHG
jgi:hypothetical protein